MNEYMDYGYQGAAAPWNYYLWPTLKSVIHRRNWTDRRAFDLGCGNGATCNMLSELGFDVTGVDMSASGITIAQKAYPQIHANVGSVYDDLAGQYGTFPLVVSLEVIEHCMYPRLFLRTFLSLIEPGGIGFLSTPYHGYLKNLVLALSGRMDRHFTVLWDGGHVKFFSIATLRQLLQEEGISEIKFVRVGRVPALAKSMIVVVGQTLEQRRKFSICGERVII
jgi:2-polyprenyl-3-methyl-5-hydroxy-6-metoxy-1,4-benzoquinol methylase